MKEAKLKIEKGVPIPASGGNKGYSDALRKMSKGDSVVLPCTMNSAQSVARFALGQGAYVCRAVEGGTRVWKIK